MLDINLFRTEKGGNPEIVRESQRKRNASVQVVDQIIALDAEWVKARFNADAVNREINKIKKDIAALMKANKKDDSLTLVEEKVKKEAQKQTLDALVKEKEKDLNKVLMSVGNLVHESCVVSNDEKDNKIVRSWWPEGRSEQVDIEKKKNLIKKDNKGVLGFSSHHEVLERLEGYDPVRGAKVAGHRGYFLTGVGLDLNLAIIRYGLDFLDNRDFTKIQTPFFMNKDMMAKTAQLEEFDEALYKCVGETDADGKENEESSKYLIATSEQPISALHADEWFSSEELPKKYAGLSTCFRKEAGAHGRDTWGLFRVHQFEKVEQFVLTDTEKSWEMHEEMLLNSQTFYESLKLPYRVVSIVSGALNNAAAKKYDLEAWFPFQGDYKELVSCSNCTDYQSRRLEIRVGAKKLNDSTKKYAHALNCTLTAVGRTICGILENYQTEEGVVVPDVLVPYMNGKTFLPYPKSRGASAKKAAKVTELVEKMQV